MNKTWMMIVLGALVLSTASPASADRRDRRERREERREDRRDRREDRREQRQERREDRRDNRRDARSERRDSRWDRRDARSDRMRPNRRPPAVRVERWQPRRGHVWVSGHWDWNGADWAWVGGRYERERRGYRYAPRRWEERDGVYVSIGGDWVSAGPTIAPPAMRVERWRPRRGYVWVEGHWDWRGNDWTWVSGHYERERRGQRWRPRRWEQRGGVYVSVDGGWSIN